MVRYHFSVRNELNLYVYRLEEQNIYSPRWRNGSVIVLHAIGSGSIPLRGTKGDNRQGAEQVCKTSLGRFDSYWPHKKSLAEMLKECNDINSEMVSDAISICSVRIYGGAPHL